MDAPTWTIDDDTLRERPDDVEAARRRVRELESEGPAGDDERMFWLRILGELDAAEKVGRRALARACSASEPLPGGVTTEAAGPLRLGALGPALRLAVVLQWQHRFEEADALFHEVLRAARAQAAAGGTGRRARAYEAFAHQHLGKSLFDQARLAEALEHFRAALHLRVEDDAPADQLGSTRQAIAATEARLARTGPHPGRCLPAAPAEGRQ